MQSSPAFDQPVEPADEGPQFPFGLSLPSAPNELLGMGEQIDVDAASGSLSCSVPIKTPAARSGVAPNLALSYNGAAGQSVFGLRWNIGLPAIVRSSRHHLPTYDDDADEYELSGGDTLVPGMLFDGTQWQPEVRREGVFSVRRFRPRIEGAFVRIERWSDTVLGEVHWRSIGTDNVTSIFGRSANARIADPGDLTRIAEWLLETVSDDRGNALAAVYKAEDAVNVDTAAIFERNKTAFGFANRYPKRIFFANAKPTADAPVPAMSAPDGDVAWHFQIVFDYGEHAREQPTPSESQPWTQRLDPFSTYRNGFERRTHRLCQRVLTFHRFETLGQDPVLVHATEFEYAQDTAMSLLQSVSRIGYARRPNGGGITAALPPVTFDYATALSSQAARPICSDDGTPLNIQVDGTSHQFVDLESNGMPGLLYDTYGTWLYRRNLGDGRFAPPLEVPVDPALARSTAGRPRFVDVAGDGNKGLLTFGAALAGSQERRADGSWTAFAPFRSVPRVAADDATIRFADLDGDGRADLLTSTPTAFVWYPSLGRDGFGPPRSAPFASDEENGPAQGFDQTNDALYFADMSGDGLSDIVRVRNSEIAYWPNLGYGQFGRKVTMDDCPTFDQPERFRPSRVRLNDVNGTGKCDVLYLGADETRVWANAAGNRFGAETIIAGFPRVVDNADAISIADVLGQGSPCLVWSSSLVPTQPLQFLDLVGSTKPYSLVRVTNNCGTQTEIAYTPSTAQYRADELAGSGWNCWTSSSIGVTSQITRHDTILNTIATTDFHYRDGYFDPVEREARGFGSVESAASEVFEPTVGAGRFTLGPLGIGPALQTSPAVTRTWFHHGDFIGDTELEARVVRGYFQTDAGGAALEAVHVPTGMGAIEEQQGRRALLGRRRRVEVYARDGTVTATIPYQTIDYTYALVPVQPVQADVSPYSVGWAAPRETLTTMLERAAVDPRISHEIALAYDAYGNATAAATVAYARAAATAVDEAQRTPLVLYAESSAINQTSDALRYRIGVPAEKKRYAVTGLALSAPLFTAETLTAAIGSATELPYEAVPPPNLARKRLVRHTRFHYAAADLSGPLPLGDAGPRALLDHTERLAFTPGLLTMLLPATVAPLADGYVLDGSGYWISSARLAYDAARFFRAIQYIDPFGNVTSATYDGTALLLTGFVDALLNATNARNDYVALAPAQLIDRNANRTAADFDALGRLTAVAKMGKVGAVDGDTLAAPTVSIEYDQLRWQFAKTPNVAHYRSRVQHASASAFTEAFVYYDGRGRRILSKAAAPGNGAAMWVGSNRVVADAAGNPVKTYDDYFSTTADFENANALEATGAVTVTRFDVLGRAVRVDHPNGTFSQTTHRAWTATRADLNDTVKASLWYSDRLASLDPTESRAASITAPHDGTPLVEHLNPSGLPFLIQIDNGSAIFTTKAELTVLGEMTALIDAREIRALEHDYDMAGRAVRTRNADGGTDTIWRDLLGLRLRTWDETGAGLELRYDEMRRCTHTFVHLAGVAGAARLAQRVVYGEALGTTAQARNLRGVAYLRYDDSGLLRCDSADFDGNCLQRTKQLATDFASETDWTVLEGQPTLVALMSAGSTLLDLEPFTTSMTYDALGRLTTSTLPDGSIVKPSYDRAHFIRSLDVQMNGAAATLPIVTAIERDALGTQLQRTCANGTVTNYQRNPLDRRLKRQITTASGSVLQDLLYAYDPMGNITETDDRSQQTVYFANVAVTAGSRYAYDPLYRLTSAEGREAISQNTAGAPTADDLPFANLPGPGDATVLARYLETYRYDAVGNLTQVAHNTVTAGPLKSDWISAYTYGASNNRLLSRNTPGDVYGYDTRGNITQMPHLTALRWNAWQQIRSVDLGGGGTLYNVYDSEGERVRKVIRRQGGLIEDRIYLDGYELFRRRNATGIVLERQTLVLREGSQQLALVETKTIDGGAALIKPSPLIRYQLNDAVGSSLVELDNTAAVISYEQYHPFGTSAFRARAATFGNSDRRYRYAWRERDDGSSLYYNKSRYYAPWLGRWTSPDPAGMVDGTNRYAYVQNNPTTLCDPDGLQSQESTNTIIQRRTVITPFPPPDIHSGPRQTARGVVTHDVQCHPNKLGEQLFTCDIVDRLEWKDPPAKPKTAPPKPKSPSANATASSAPSSASTAALPPLPPPTAGTQSAPLPTAPQSSAVPAPVPPPVVSHPSKPVAATPSAAQAPRGVVVLPETTIIGSPILRVEPLTDARGNALPSVAEQLRRLDFGAGGLTLEPGPRVAPDSITPASTPRPAAQQQSTITPDMEVGLWYSAPKHPLVPPVRYYDWGYGSNANYVLNNTVGSVNNFLTMIENLLPAANELVETGLRSIGFNDGDIDAFNVWAIAETGPAQLLSEIGQYSSTFLKAAPAINRGAEVSNSLREAGPGGAAAAATIAKGSSGWTEADVEKEGAFSLAQRYPEGYPLNPSKYMGGAVPLPPAFSSPLPGSAAFQLPAGANSPPLRLLFGGEYFRNRIIANITNAAIRAACNFHGLDVEIHEVIPVKFGGSPTDFANKILLMHDEHVPFTTWWREFAEYIILTNGWNPRTGKPL